MTKPRHSSTPQSNSSSGRSRRHSRTEVSAGGVVFRRAEGGIEFAMLMDPFDKWTFPKGHVRRARKESYEKAAKREVKEEIGLSDVELVAPLGKIEIWFQDRFVHKGARVHKFIHYFLFEAPGGAKLKKDTKKQVREYIQEVAWVPASKMREKCGYDDLDSILDEAEKVLDLG